MLLRQVRLECVRRPGCQDIRDSLIMGRLAMYGSITCVFDPEALLPIPHFTCMCERATEIILNDTGNNGNSQRKSILSLHRSID